MANTPWCGYNDNKLYLTSGQFTSTLKTSQYIGDIDTAILGISWDGTDTPWCGNTGDKLYLQSGKFSSTLKTSQDISSVDTTISGVSCDETNTLWSGSEADKLYLTSGRFSSTLKTSQSVAGIETNPSGISFDGTNTPWCGTTDNKLYLTSGQFTSTLKTSQEVGVIDGTPSGISWDGTDTPWCGDTDNKLYLQSGQFTSTLKTSQGVGLIDSNVFGISIDDVNARLGIAEDEFNPSYWTVIVQNNDATADIEIEDLGVIILADSNTELTGQFAYDKLCGSEDLKTIINDELLVVNDGDNDLSKENGVKFLAIQNVKDLEDNYYNITEIDAELETKIEGNTGSVDNTILISSGTGGKTLKAATDTFIDNGKIGIDISSPTQKLEINYGHLRINQEPSAAKPTVAVNATPGNLNGAYRYKITFVTESGETNVRYYSLSVLPVNQQVNLTNIPIGTSKVIARKIYRTVAGAVHPYPTKLVTTISDNTTTTYTDNIADGSLGESENVTNSTGGYIYINEEKVFDINSLNCNIGYNAAGQSGGLYNVAIGASSANNNTGYKVTAVGNGSANSNSGDNISSLGYGAASGNSGDNVSCVGCNSGGINTGNNLVSFGWGAAFQNTGNNVTGIGYSAVSDNVADNVVAIGYQSGSNNTVANQFIIKQANINNTPLIQGDFNSGYVGIGLESPLAQLHTTGGRIVGTTRITDSTSALDEDDHVIFVDTDGNAVQLELPPGVEGTQYRIINCGGSGNDVTIIPDGSETIWGESDITLADGDIIDLVFNSINFWW